jgi:bla regulator protein blaR1
MIANSSPGMWWAVLLGVGDHLWQSTLFALVIALLAFALRKNQARMRYWLWLAASAKFLIPLSLLIILGSHLTWLRHEPSRTNAGANNTSYLVMEVMSQPFALAAGSSKAAIHLSAPMIVERPSVTSHVAASLGPIPLFPAIVAAVWLCGFWVVLATSTIRWWKINAAIQKALPMTKGREVDVLRRMEYLGGVQQRIELKSLPISLEPGIFGLFRPLLLWPQGISERVEDAHLEAILLHESVACAPARQSYRCRPYGSRGDLLVSSPRLVVGDAIGRGT